MVGIPDVITYANYDEDRLRGLGVAVVKVCPSPLTLIVALTTYRTIVLVCHSLQPLLAFPTPAFFTPAFSVFPSLSRHYDLPASYEL